jgi:hypothetical protein
MLSLVLTQTNSTHAYLNHRFSSFLSPPHHTALPPATKEMQSAASRIALLSLISILYLGAFSRSTHGQYTQSFYQYQLDRAPDNEYTWIIPVADAVLATMLLFDWTRTIAAFLCGLGQFGAIVSRLLEQQDVGKDLVIFGLAMYVCLQSWNWFRYVQ